MEPHGYVERDLGEGSEEVGSACGSRAVFGGLAENDYVHAMRSRSTSRRTVHASGVRSPSEQRQRSVDSRENFLFPENFEQMIKTWSHSVASRREPCRMNDGAEFYAELGRGTF